MKRILLVFLTLLFTSIVQARLGETFEESKSNHPNFVLIGSNKFSDRVFIAVFSSEIGEEIGVFYLDGKSAEEIISSTDDNPPIEALGEYMQTYSPDWVPVFHPTPGVKAVKSADGAYYAIYGPAPWLNKEHVFRIFTKAWHDYVLDQKMDKI